MPDTDAEATARAEADPMGLEVLEAVDVGGTWTVTGDGDAAPPPPPKPAEPPPSSKLAERPPAPMPAPPPPPNPVTPPAPVKATVPPTGSSPRRIGRWLIAAAFVAGVAVAVPLAVAAANFAHRVPNAPVPVVAGSVPARYLAGTSSARVEAAAVSRGLRCSTPPQSVGSSATTSVRVCQRVSGGWVASVAIAGQDASHLVAVTAGVSRGPAEEATDLALLEAIVDAAVARRSAAADDTWLSAHFDRAGDNQTVVNGVLLRLMVQDTIRSLVIIPAP
jgi:hypothetical protein